MTYLPSKAKSSTEEIFDFTLDPDSGALFQVTDRISVPANTTSWNGRTLFETWNILKDIPISAPKLTIYYSEYNGRETTQIEIKVNGVSVEVKTQSSAATLTWTLPQLYAGDVITIWADAIKGYGASTYYGYLNNRTLVGSVSGVCNAVEEA